MGIDVELWIPITDDLDVEAIVGVVCAHRDWVGIHYDEKSFPGWLEFALLDREMHPEWSPP